MPDPAEVLRKFVKSAESCTFGFQQDRALAALEELVRAAALAGTAPDTNAKRDLLNYIAELPLSGEQFEDLCRHVAAVRTEDVRLFKASLAVGAPAAPAPETEPLIHSHPGIRGGEPVVVGSRIPFEMLVSIRRAGESVASLRDAYPGVPARVWELVDALAGGAAPGRAPSPEPTSEALMATIDWLVGFAEMPGVGREAKQHIRNIVHALSSGAPPAAPAAKSADDAPHWYDAEQAKYWAYGWMDCLRNLPAAPAEPPPDRDNEPPRG